MAMQQLSLPGELVKKSNQLIRSKIIIDSVDASRILANLVACINSADTEFNEVYKVAIKDFLPDKSGRGYFRVKAICKELLYAHAEIENLEAGKERLSLIPFFRQIDYEKGVVSAEFNFNMKPLLLELRRCFTEYNLIEYLKLPSIYSQRLFEILKSWDDKPEVTISVEELHRMLNTPESFRANFKDFRRRVLDKAHNDITSKTSLYYEWEPIKQGRAVAAVRFIFAKKRVLPVAKEKEKNEIQKQSQKNTALFLAALACYQEHGTASACTGGHQPAAVCEVCKKVVSKEKKS